jgi:hypothetical protein
MRVEEFVVGGLAVDVVLEEREGRAAGGREGAETFVGQGERDAFGVAGEAEAVEAHQWTLLARTGPRRQRV